MICRSVSKPVALVLATCGFAVAQSPSADESSSPGSSAAQLLDEGPGVTQAMGFWDLTDVQHEFKYEWYPLWMGILSDPDVDYGQLDLRDWNDSVAELYWDSLFSPDNATGYYQAGFEYAPDGSQTLVVSNSVEDVRFDVDLLGKSSGPNECTGWFSPNIQLGEVTDTMVAVFIKDSGTLVDIIALEWGVYGGACFIEDVPIEQAEEVGKRKCQTGQYNLASVDSNFANYWVDLTCVKGKWGAVLYKKAKDESEYSEVSETNLVGSKTPPDAYLVMVPGGGERGPCC